MHTIAVTYPPPNGIDRLHAAFPDARVFHIDLAQGGRFAARNIPPALLVGEEPLRKNGITRLAVLKLRHPEIATVAFLSAAADLARSVFAMGQAGVDELLIEGIDDHPNQIRQAFSRAAVYSIARTVEQACRPGSPVLAAQNIVPALTRIETLRRPGALAAAFGISLTTLRNELRAGGLCSPKLMLGLLRVMMAARRLGDTGDSVQQIAAEVGYGTPRALNNACHRLLGSTPHEIRSRGGLGFAGRRFRAALEAELAA
jgi:AraC-like DNA-binding protein